MSKNGKIITPKEDKEDLERKQLLLKNRKFICEELGLDPFALPDSAVAKLVDWYPDPMLWKNKLVIAIPCGELGYARFWQHLMTVQWVGWHMDHNRIVTSSGQYIHDAHNAIIADVLTKDDWNYLVFLEHDHVFPSDMLVHIGQEYTDAIVGGLYFNRVPEDPQPVVYNWNTARTSLSRLQPYQMAPILEKPGFHEVDVVPMGVTAIRRDVLENWPKGVPYFAAPTSPHNGKSMSDDVWFCRQAQEQGYRVVVDSKLIAKHLGLVPFDERFYVAWVKSMAEQGKTGKVADQEFSWVEGS